MSRKTVKINRAIMFCLKENPELKVGTFVELDCQHTQNRILLNVDGLGFMFLDQYVFAQAIGREVFDQYYDYKTESFQLPTQYIVENSNPLKLKPVINN
jgi:hypothetical protein